MGLQYDRYIVNGFRFHVREVERKRKTQNSGVTVHAMTSSFASTRDNNPVLGDLDYYGTLTRVIELIYVSDQRIVLFDCEWVSKGKRLKQDEDGFTLANFEGVQPHNEPFILASQASQVFYVEDPDERGWHVVVATNPRAAYKMEEMADVEMYLQSELGNVQAHDTNDGYSWVRMGAEGVEVDIPNI